MKYGTGAPGQVGWAVGFVEILLRFFFLVGFYFCRGPPPKKTRVVTRKSKAQPVYAIKVGYIFYIDRHLNKCNLFL